MLLKRRQSATAGTVIASVFKQDCDCVSGRNDPRLHSRWSKIGTVLIPKVVINDL